MRGRFNFCYEKKKHMSPLTFVIRPLSPLVTRRVLNPAQRYLVLLRYHTPFPTQSLHTVALQSNLIKCKLIVVVKFFLLPDRSILHITTFRLYILFSPSFFDGSSGFFLSNPDILSYCVIKEISLGIALGLGSI